MSGKYTSIFLIVLGLVGFYLESTCRLTAVLSAILGTGKTPVNPAQPPN